MYLTQLTKIFIVAAITTTGLTTYANNSTPTNSTKVPTPTQYTYKNDYQEKGLYQENAGNVSGNAKGMLTIVDFSDYFCGPCRDLSKSIDNLVKKDNQLRVVYVDYPVLGPGSTFAANAALASLQQNKYLPFHQSMMRATKPLTEEEVYKLASEQGIVVSKLKTDMQSKQNVQAMLNNFMLANAFSIVGVPTIVAGYTDSPHNTRVYIGLDPQDLQALITQMEQTRAASKG